MPRSYRRRRSAYRRRRTGGFNWGNFASGLMSALPSVISVGQGLYNTYKQSKTPTTSGYYRRRRTGGPTRRPRGPPRYRRPRY